jgi:hypothetical protein
MVSLWPWKVSDFGHVYGQILTVEGRGQLPSLIREDIVGVGRKDIEVTDAARLPSAEWSAYEGIVDTLC